MRSTPDSDHDRHRRFRQMLAVANHAEIDGDALLKEMERVDAAERLLRESAGVLKDDDIPGWQTSEATSAWVRAQRQLDEQRFARLTDDDEGP